MQLGKIKLNPYFARLFCACIPYDIFSLLLFVRVLVPFLFCTLPLVCTLVFFPRQSSYFIFLVNTYVNTHRITITVISDVCVSSKLFVVWYSQTENSLYVFMLFYIFKYTLPYLFHFCIIIRLKCRCLFCFKVSYI